MTTAYNFFGAAMPLTPLNPSTEKYVTLSDAVNGVLTAPSGNVRFDLNRESGYTIVGNGGNDIFYAVTSGDTIINPAGTGVSTVYAQGDYVLPANIKNMVVNWATSGVMGNALSNLITTTVPKITIDGGAGNDVMTGGTGDSYRFDAGSGYDVITDFHTGARTSVQVNPDTVQLSGYKQFTSFTQVKAAMTQSGSNVILKLDANDSIMFDNTTIASFSADNFLLASSVNTATMTKTFDDEFNSLSASGGGLTTLWRTDYGWGGNSNAVAARHLNGSAEKEIYVDPTMVSTVTGTTVGINPFSITNGVLNIHAAPTPAASLAALSGYQDTSGMLSTRDSFTQTYGYFQATMTLPAGGGAWPAFWLYSTSGNGAEIDVMESHGSDSYTATEHDLTSGKDMPGQTNVYAPDLTAGEHTFGVLWTASTITWYLDGVAVRSIATPSNMHGPMYMMVDLALDNTTPANFTGANMQVDSVQAYSLNNLPSTVTGSGSNDMLNDLAGATVLSGGGGNDSFYVTHAGTQVVEASGGTDTVTATVNYVLPANITKLVLSGTATTGTSNAVGGTLVANNNGDTLIGVGGHDTLIGGSGNDTIRAGTGITTMTGGGGSDTFVIAKGFTNDTITDFSLKQDQLNLSALSGQKFTLKDSTQGAILQISGAATETLLLTGIHAADLAASSAFHVASIHASAGSYTGVF